MSDIDKLEKTMKQYFWALLVYIGFCTCVILVTLGTSYGYTDADLWTETDVYAVYFYEDPAVTLEWTAVQGATYYEFQVVWIDPDPVVVIATGQSPTNQVTINRVRTGHIAFKVNSCNAQGCSDWCYSTDKACSQVWVDPNFVDQGWMLFWRPAQPTGVGIQ